MSFNNKRVYYFILAAAVLLLAAAIVLFSRFPAGKKDPARADYPIYFTEIMTDNLLHPNGDGICCDYVELYNSASYTVDISGYRLTDGKNYYSFPKNTVMHSHDSLRVYCCKEYVGDFYAPFGLSAQGGETVSFVTRKGAVLDSVVTIRTGNDRVMSRTEKGWEIADLPASAPADEQESSESAAVPPARINELLQQNASYPNPDGKYLDFIELYNDSDSAADLSGWKLTDDPLSDKYVFPSGTTIPAHDYLVIFCSSTSTGFGLSSEGGESVFLKDEMGSTRDHVITKKAETDHAYGRDPDGKFVFFSFATPGHENSEAGWESWCGENGAGGSDLSITELMASNRSTLADSYGEFSDWLELTNLGDKTVDLSGWCLSDDEADLRKWAFPEVSLGPNERLLVFCSGRDCVRGEELHASFRLSASGETVFLTAPGGSVADRVVLPFGEPDRSFVIDPVSSSVTETALPTPGFPNDESGFEAFSATRTPVSALAIWEVMVSNDRYLMENGKGYDWVELRNCSDKTISLGGYTLSDDSDHPELCSLPDVSLEPGAYYAVMLSGDSSLSGSSQHADFSLNAAEDHLYLYENSRLVDYVHLIDVPNLESMGRLPDNGGFFYMEPTPLEDNLSGWRTISEKPAVSAAGGIYSEKDALTVSLSAPGSIYFTLDGSTPTREATRYEGPIPIGESCVLRAAAFEDGKRQSETVSASYMIGTKHSMPVVSLTADPSELFGSAGIYQNNWNTKEIEIPANISYFGKDGTFSLDCGISVHGMTSLLVSDKKSFTVRFRNNYDGPLNYDLFGDGEITEYSSILLRADVESTVSTMTHDNIFGVLASANTDGLMGMKYKYAALYINGQYWGIYSIREHYSTEYYASHMNCSPAQCIMLKSFSLPGDSLYEVREFMEANSPADPENYAYVRSKLDVESFADWIILEAYSGNADINGNMRYFYSETDRLWRCAMCDLDLGLTADKQTAGWEFPIESLQHGYMVRSLLESPEFCQLLLERLSFWLNGPLSETEMNRLLDSMTTQLIPELENEAERWSGFSIELWQADIDMMKKFFSTRGEFLIKSLYVCNIYPSAEECERYFGGMT